MIAWGFVPARGGSKSIPLKNMVMVAGRPLLDYGILAAQASGRLARIVCSTDDGTIGRRARELGVEIDDRLAHLSGDETLVDDVVREYLERTRCERELPDVIVLIQPTCPFLLPEHVVDLIDVLIRDDAAASAHNVVDVPHIAHAWNQRILASDGRVTFRFAVERSQARMKQQKPTLKMFGNLIAARTDAILTGRGFYAEPCAGIEIMAPYHFDLDGPEDVAVAAALVETGAVELAHLSV